MVAACVATLRLDIRDFAIFVDNLLDEPGEFGVDEIGNDAHALRFPGVKRALDVSGLFGLLVSSLFTTTFLQVSCKMAHKSMEAPGLATLHELQPRPMKMGNGY